MQNNEQLHVNFKEMLSDATEINKILESINLGYMKFEKILSDYEKENNRYGVIFIVNFKNKNKQQKIIIDAIYNEPNVRQVKDLTYDSGLECEKRIILYTYENRISTMDEFWYEKEMAEGFIEVNNDCGFNTYMVKVSLDSARNYKYEAKICPNYKSWTSLEKIATKQDFERAIFTVIYDQTDPLEGDSYDYKIDRINTFRGTYRFLDFDGILYKFPIWDENGLFVFADSITKGGSDILRSIKMNNQKNMKIMFMNRQPIFENNEFGWLTMRIKLWDKPINVFTQACIGDKEKIARHLHRVSSRIFEYFDECHLMDGGFNRDVDDYLALPEDTFNELENEISA